MRSKRLLISLILLTVIGVVGNLAYRWYVGEIKSKLQALCNQARSAGDWPAMERIAIEWATWDPDRQQAWIDAAAAAQEMGDPLRTIEYLKRVPGNPPLPVLLELASLQHDVLNDPLASIETCERSIELYPDSDEAHNRLLYFYAMTRQRGKVIREARRALGVEADTPQTCVYLIGADWIIFKNGSEINRKWLRERPKYELFEVADIIHLTSAMELSELAEQAPDSVGKSRGEYFESRIGELLSKYPKNIELLAFVLAQHCQHGKTEEVAKLMAQAPPESLNDSRFWRFKGWFHSANEEWPEAEASYRKAIELYPYDWQSLHELSAVLRRTNKFEQVEKYQEAATLGKQILKDVLSAPRTDQVSPETYEKIISYAQMVGDEAVAKRLRERLKPQ